MEKKKTSEETILPMPHYGEGWAVTSEKANRLVARQMAFIEALGLPQKQEDAVKEQLKEILYSEIYDHYWWMNSDEIANVIKTRVESYASAVPAIIVNERT